MTRDYDAIVNNYIAKMKNEDQQKTLQKYVRYCKEEGKNHKKKGGQSIRTVYSKVLTINAIAEYHSDKAFENFTRDEIEDYIYSDAFRLSRKVGKDGKKKKIAPSSIENYKVNIKTFFKWVHYHRDRHLMKKTVYPDCVDWIEIQQIVSEKTPDELLTDEEVFKMINSCSLLRDQLMIILYYDTGARLSEILDLTEDKILPDSYGFSIVVDGKTNSRNIRLVASVPYLKKYMQNPVKGRYLIRTRHGRMSDARAESIVKEAATDAGVEKKITPHLFRHGKMTALASKLTEPELRKFAGWKPNSNMPGTYVHLNNEHIDSRILELNGIKKEEEKPGSMATTTCPRCQELNGATQAFCWKCGLDLRAEVPYESELDILKREMKINQTKLMMMERLQDRITQYHENAMRDYEPRPEFPEGELPIIPSKIESKPRSRDEKIQELKDELTTCMQYKKLYPSPEIDCTINLIQEALEAL
jgi:integrase